MKTMKTSELTGAALDWAVCVAKGETRKEWLENPYSYSTNWLFGGPIIDRERICVIPCADERGRYWAAGFSGPNARWEGTTPLIAAMRCYVASKLGDSVEVPEELP